MILTSFEREKKKSVNVWSCIYLKWIKIKNRFHWWQATLYCKYKYTVIIIIIILTFEGGSKCERLLHKTLFNSKEERNSNVFEAFV